MKKANFSKSRILVLFLSFSAALWMTVLVVYTMNTKGMIGWATWEWFGLLGVLLFSAFAVLPLVFFILTLVQEKKKKPTVVVSSVSMILSLTLTLFLLIGGNLSGLNANLNFYSSSDGYLSSTSDIRIAVASDSHWGASGSNREARTAIMDTIESGSYDLMIHGGDVVDLGFVKSYYEEAIRDMEAHFPTQKIHFVMGNHDALVNGERNFRKVFQPGETSLSHVLEPAPHVHWVIFNMIWDTSEVKPSDIRWLETTLASFPEEDFVAVQTHAHIYGSGSRDVMARWYDVSNNIDTFAPIFEKNHVDLVVSGHVHSMEMMEMNGVHYCLVGPFGGSLFNDFRRLTVANSTFLDGTHYGFVSFDIRSDSTLTVDFRDERGTSLYQTVLDY